MARDAYVNGRFLPHRLAKVSIDDRAFVFADGVYEVVPVVNGQLVDEALHLNRLERSLGELRIAMPMKRRTLQLVSHELIRRNKLTYGFLYLQISRGVAPRDHKFPVAATPSVVMTTKQLKPASAKTLSEGVGVITVPDIRWQRRDIKSVSLLPNVLAKQAAVEQGALEAWQVDDKGFVTEGSSTNAWIITKDGKVVTRPATFDILNGITRQVLLTLIASQGLGLEERAFTVQEAREAREAFLTSSTNFVMPVTKLDGHPVGNGHPGIATMKLRAAYLASFATAGSLQ